MKMPITSIGSNLGIEVLPDIYSYTVQIVNICFIGDPMQTNEFILVDAGMPDTSDMILKKAEERFGKDFKIKAIVLTHGHFDHVGGLHHLIHKYDCPVYAHPLEAPYLTGKSDYPKPNLEVEGLIAKLSFTFPRESIDISSHLNVLANDGSIPVLPDWQFIHTPGHTPGHISLFREQDGVIIAGDAFINVEQEKFYDVFTQKEEIHGPPAYFTQDWNASWDSVKKISALNPKYAVTGHGLPLYGQDLIDGLNALANNFDKTEIPINR